MDKLILSLLRLFILFVRNVFGCFNSPYVTFRKLASETAGNQTIFIILLSLFYFLFVALMRDGLSNPFLLTVKFNSLMLSATISFAAMTLFLFLGGRLLGGKGEIVQIYTLWSFTLVPTLVWFFVTSLLYLILPPPRTMSFWGKFYSVVYVAFSLSVLIWKSILYYLTLRFALKLDLWRIALITVIMAPMISGYAVLMYRLGIFRVPFI